MMREPLLSEEQRLARRRAHVCALGLSDEVKDLLRTEIKRVLRTMPAGLSAEEQTGYETACNDICRRLLAL